MKVTNEVGEGRGRGWREERGMKVTNTVGRGEEAAVKPCFLGGCDG